jgi:predicted transcriptional regulator
LWLACPLPFREGLESLRAVLVLAGVSLGSHRTALQILADILSVARGGARKTRIMYQANLSFRLLNRYLGYAMEIELISASRSGDGRYALTLKGHEFLEKYSKYSLQSRQLEEQQRVIVKEKATLEENYVARMNSVNSKSSLAKQGKTVEMRSS